MMKNINFYLSICVLIVATFSSCKEEPPYINYTPPQSIFDTTYLTATYSATPKQVLIEDISGAGCSNCPKAATIAHSIIDANAGRVNEVTIYPNNTSFSLLVLPINSGGFKSKYDFTSDIAKQLITYVSVPGTLPSGYIDRKFFSGNWYEPKENWTSDVAAELSVSSPLNIDIVPTYNSSNNTLNVVATITYTAADSGSNYIHVMILQDSIIDVQESTDANGNVFYDSTYVHNHTLMDMLTAPTGDLLNTNTTITLVPGRVFKIGYQKTLGARTGSHSAYPQPPWDTKHLSVLVFVTEGSTTKYVLQSKIVAVQ